MDFISDLRAPGTFEKQTFMVRYVTKMGKIRM